MPFGNLTNMTGTVSAAGSWNDEVFSGSANDVSFLAGHRVEDARAGDGLTDARCARLRSGAPIDR